MKSTLLNLQGVNVLGKAQQKQIKGSGPCGVLVNGAWVPMPDMNGNGTTKEEAIDDATQANTRWCCDSCPWN